MGPQEANVFKSKCMVQHLDQYNPRYEFILGEYLTGNSPVEKDLGVMVEEKMNMSQQYVLAAQKTNCILDCIRREVASYATLLCSHEASSGVQHSGLRPPAQDRAVESDPEEATKMTRGLKHTSYEEKLRQ